MEARFIRDETLPDGNPVAPGTKLKKTFVLQNTGTSAWTPSTTAVCKFVSPFQYTCSISFRLVSDGNNSSCNLHAEFLRLVLDG